VADYRAFAIGPEELAIRVHELDVQNDAEALEKAAPLCHDGLKRLEVWCGSRKVGEISPKQTDVRDSGSICDPA
jgi:hypothetical protein